MKKTRILVAAIACAASLSANAWMCEVVNSYKNQLWTGTGPTRAIALENAMMFCSNHSQFVKNCQPTRCYQ